MLLDYSGRIFFFPPCSEKKWHVICMTLDGVIEDELNGLAGASLHFHKQLSRIAQSVR
ncbi:hypothetical protein OEJ37_11580 [Burkholderia sp. BKH01]|uniref:hypothetical protein n=1 Tax=Burkholderia sp. BKH01 TaxID=2769262 RepID=UPI0021E0C2E4|nr:hypothetical protein [Burkholderia sp. BKH01]MCU9953998.1 hypothetical protein [Burkholderia sp. BKH01]